MLHLLSRACPVVLWVWGSLPRHLSVVRTQLSSALLPWAPVKALDQPPNGTLLFNKGKRP